MYSTGGVGLPAVFLSELICAMQMIKIFNNTDVARDMDRQGNADIFPTCVVLVVLLVVLLFVLLFVLLVLCRFTTPRTDMSTTVTVDAATPIATTGELLHSPPLQNSFLYMGNLMKECSLYLYIKSVSGCESVKPT